MSLSRRFGERIAWIQDEILRQSPDDVINEVRARLFDQSAAYRITSRKRGFKAAMAAAACLAIAVAAVLLSKPAGPLTVEMGDGGTRIEPGDWISAPSTTAVPLRFSDGSSVTLEPSSGARIVDVDANGARILLERGAARMKVTHRPETSWKLVVGPYTVTITGTAFAVSWDPGLEKLVLDQQEGSVVVRGPMVSHGRQLAAGETFRAWVGEERMEIASARSRQPAETELDRKEPQPVESVEPAQVEATEITEVPAPLPAVKTLKTKRIKSPSARSGPHWQSLARDGKLDEILEQAENRGFDRVLATASARDLMLLGDAARLNRQWKRADQTYRTVRKRFPKGKWAAPAALSLGRMAFDQQKHYTKAARWFEVYLREQKEGTLVREARGRLMEARHRAGDTVGARNAARQYLSAYPGGPHAPFARELTSSNKD